MLCCMLTFALYCHAVLHVDRCTVSLCRIAMLCCCCSNQGAIKTALDGKAKEKVESMVELIYTDVRGGA